MMKMEAVYLIFMPYRPSVYVLSTVAGVLCPNPASCTQVPDIIRFWLHTMNVIIAGNTLVCHATAVIMYLQLAMQPSRGPMAFAKNTTKSSLSTLFGAESSWLIHSFLSTRS